jgi:hypothetical protein
MNVKGPLALLFRLYIVSFTFLLSPPYIVVALLYISQSEPVPVLSDPCKSPRSSWCFPALRVFHHSIKQNENHEMLSLHPVLNLRYQLLLRLEKSSSELLGYISN